MVNIDRGNVYITSGTVSGDTITGGITVRVDHQKLDHNFVNQIIEFNIPVSPGNKANTAPDAQLVDLKRIKHVVTINGWLCTESTESAFTKKKNLMVLVGYGSTSEDSLMTGLTIKSGNVTVVYGQDAQSTQHKMVGNITALTITETPGHVNDGSTDTEIYSKYAVQIKIVVGNERG